MNHHPRLPTFAFLLASAFCLLASSHADPIKPADFPRPEKPPFGVNLEGNVDFAHSMMFVDLIKSARKFGSPDKPWDQICPVDSNGWPTQDAGIVVVADAPLPPGDYNFSCTGKCTLATVASAASIKSQSYDKSTNTTTAVVSVPTPEPGTESLQSLFLSFKDTDKGIQNIRLLRPGYSLKSPDVFNKDFLAAIAPFSTLRTMDFTRTNNNPSKAWTDRARVTDALQSSDKGVAWEYVIELSNVSGKDLWINIPALASDEYVTELAKLMKNTLNKDRVVYIEYSNEVWNWMFQQTRQNSEAAKAEVAAANAGGATTTLNAGNNDPNMWAWRRVPKRLLEITRLFNDVYSNRSLQPNTPTPELQYPPNIRPVLASQSATPFILRSQLEFIEKHYGPPSKYIYAVAGAPYIFLEGPISNRDDLTTDDLFKTHLPHALKTAQKWITDYQVLAKHYRVHHLSYEGGPHLDNEHSLQQKLAANRDDRMGKLIADYLTTWYASGGELFVYYNLASSYNKWGSWGLTEDIRKSSPKLKAVTALLNAPTPPLAPADKGGAGYAVPGTITLESGITEYLLVIQSAGDYEISSDPASPPPTFTLSGNTPKPPIHLDPGQLTLKFTGTAPTKITFQRK